MSEIYRNTTLTDSEKSKEQLLDELREMRQQISELELIKSRHKRTNAELQIMLFSIEHVAESAFWVGPDGKFIYVNEVACKTLGYSRDELIRMKIHEILPDSSEEAWQELWEVLKNRNSFVAESVNRTSKGSAFPVEMILNYLVFEGKEYGFIVARDISERKEAEEKVRESERGLQRKQIELEKKHLQLSKLFKEVEISKKEWESTMDCVEDMVILADSNGAIKRFNRAFLEFAGRSREEVEGKKWEDFISEQELKTITYYAGSIDLYHEPSRRWFQFKAYPFEDKELDFSGAVIALHETTEIKNIAGELEKAYDELKSAQSQMLQREKMASIGQLAAGVAHEINNPIGFIKSNLSTLDKYINKIMEFINIQDKAVSSIGAGETVDQINEERKKLKLDYILNDINQLINESLEGAERVNGIVQNLRGFSRVDESEYKAVDINECIESTINIVWNDLKYKATVKKEYDELPPVNCYPQQLNQVFLNLLINSVQAIEKKGEINIKTWFSEGNVHVSISDTGGGIPEEKISKVFEPFFTTKPVGEGTGLGLSIAYDIIKKHKGNIIAESIPGKGTVFTVILPAF